MRQRQSQSQGSALKVRPNVRVQMPDPRVETEWEPVIRAKGQNWITLYQGRLRLVQE